SRRILVADQRMISVWSADGVFERGRQASLNGSLRWTMAHDGQRAAVVASAGEPQLWDPRTLRFLAPLNHGDPQARAARLSPDGRYFVRSVPRPALPGWDVGIWDVDSSLRVWHVRLPDNERFTGMYSGAISDDNRLVAIGRFGGQTLVWPWH